MVVGVAAIDDAVLAGFGLDVPAHATGGLPPMITAMADTTARMRAVQVGVAGLVFMVPPTGAVLAGLVVSGTVPLGGQPRSPPRGMVVENTGAFAHGTPTEPASTPIA
jgi:hypothetical protein